MFARIRSGITFGNVVALLALFVALGGTGYAALKLPKNSVGPKQIRKGAVHSSDVKNRTLKRADFKGRKLPRGRRGRRGVRGFRGPTGPRGATGGFGPVTVQYTRATQQLTDNLTRSYTVFCPAGMQAVGGGMRADDTQSEELIVGSSRPIVNPSSPAAPGDGGTFTGWETTVRNPGGGVNTGLFPEVWVHCVRAPAS